MAAAMEPLIPAVASADESLSPIGLEIRISSLKTCWHRRSRERADRASPRATERSAFPMRVNPRGSTLGSRESVGATGATSVVEGVVEKILNGEVEFTH